MILLEPVGLDSRSHSLDGATLSLPAKATAATRGQYLALSKAIQSCFGLYRRYGLTRVFVETGLPSFDTLVLLLYV